MLGITALIETHGTVHSNPTPKPINIVQDKDGRFQQKFIIHSDSITYFKNNVAVGWETIDDKAIFTFIAPNCETQRLELEVPAEEITIEMICDMNN